MNNNTSALISKLISFTKAGLIAWERYSQTNIECKPLPQSALDCTGSFQEELNRIMPPTLDKNASYLCKYGEGYFFLLLYRTSTLSSKLELRVQTDTSINSQVYASYNSSGYLKEDVNIASQLKRLYNLVDTASYTDGIDDFINSFIKD